MTDRAPLSFARVKPERGSTWNSRDHGYIAKIETARGETITVRLYHSKHHSRWDGWIVEPGRRGLAVKAETLKEAKDSATVTIFAWLRQAEPHEYAPDWDDWCETCHSAIGTGNHTNVNLLK